MECAQHTDSEPKMVLSENKYLYNGKELQDEQLGGVNLDWYSFEKRYYDPALGRFTGMDPIAEEFYHVTPYNYAENGPITNIDLWGLQALNANIAAGLIASRAKYEAIAGKGGNPLINLLVGNTRTDRIPNAVKANMSSQTQHMIDFSGQLSDAATAVEAPGALVKEVTYDAGEVSDQFGSMLTYTGLALAPFTGGVSLTLTGIGAAFTSGGNVVQAIVDFSEGNSSEGIDELATAAMSYGTSKGTAQLLKASKANDLIQTTTDFVVQGTMLNGIATAWNELFVREVMNNDDEKDDEENRQ